MTDQIHSMTGFMKKEKKNFFVHFKDPGIVLTR